MHITGPQLRDVSLVIVIHSCLSFWSFSSMYNLQMAAAYHQKTRNRNWDVSKIETIVTGQSGFSSAYHRRSIELLQIHSHCILRRCIEPNPFDCKSSEFVDTDHWVKHMNFSILKRKWQKQHAMHTLHTLILSMHQINGDYCVSITAISLVRLF